MIYKYSIKDLKKEGLIKECPIDWKMIINRAYKDMKTAERNLDEDEECTYNYAYNSMLRCGMALMFSEGYRPDINDKHLTTVRFASSFLGGKYEKITNDFDIMRRKRHRFIYEPDIPCSRIEAENALKTAYELLNIISEYIKKKNPQVSFDF